MEKIEKLLENWKCEKCGGELKKKTMRRDLSPYFIRYATTCSSCGHINVILKK